MYLPGAVADEEVMGEGAATTGHWKATRVVGSRLTLSNCTSTLSTGEGKTQPCNWYKHTRVVCWCDRHTLRSCRHSRSWCVCNHNQVHLLTFRELTITQLHGTIGVYSRNWPVWSTSSIGIHSGLAYSQSNDIHMSIGAIDRYSRIRRNWKKCIGFTS